MKKITLKPFNSFLKKIAKSDRLFLQDAEDYVYISDGHFVVRVSRYTFDNLIKPEICFDVPENSKVVVTRNIAEVQENPSSFNIKDCFTKAHENPDLVFAKMTSLRMTTGDNRLLTIFKSENGFTAIDNKFVDILLYFGFSGAMVDKNNPGKAPLVTDDFIVLPVNNPVKDILERILDPLA